ncbi:MAG: T9SS type A sorting domain-containing protein [Bacteroidetes bacterium]|nr:T9SS type A sorting domain-containing protein [Bacteroidota bacterium]
MKKGLILFTFSLLLSLQISANGVPPTRGEITEIYFGENTSWTIEVRFDFVNSGYDSALCIYSSSDSAFFKVNPTEPGIYLITFLDLTSPFLIHKNGDSLYIRTYNYGSPWSSWVTGCRFIWGDISGSRVHAPQAGQSLVGLSDLINSSNWWHPSVVKDTMPSLGYEKDPVRGTIRGYVYDSTYNPMPYQLLHINGIIDRTLWTDENGFFEDSTVYGMNYKLYVNDGNGNTIAIDTFTIEPDSVTNAELVLPLNRDIKVTGRIIPQNQQMIEGCYAIFTPECPAAPIDTFLTDTLGFFTAYVISGQYSVRYSREGHIPEFWPDLLSFYYYQQNLGLKFLLEGDAIEVERGHVTGQWNNTHPYYIFGNITISEGDSLVMDPGCELLICGDFSFNIEGTLLASGTEENNITITAHESVNNWKELNINGMGASQTYLNYCHLEYINEINIHDASPQIDHTLFYWISKFLISGQAAPSIRYSDFSQHCNNCRCTDYAQPYFSHNYFSNPGWTIMSLYDYAYPRFEHNTFYYFWCCTTYNSDSVQSAFKGNIFCKGGSLTYFGGPPTEVSYNLFFDMESYSIWIPGFGILDTINANGDSCDIYFNLIEMDPFFVDPENGNFHLLPESPCIDAGDPSFPYDPDNTIADIGAFYYDQLGIYIKEPWDIKQLYEMYAVPNPNNGNFSIHIDSPKTHHYEASINIYSLTGMLQDTKNIAFLEKDENMISFSDFGHQQNPTSGIYLCTLIVQGKIVATTKIIIRHE